MNVIRTLTGYYVYLECQYKSNVILNNPALKHTKFKMLVDSKKEKKIDLK